MEASEQLSGYRREQWTRFKEPFGKEGQTDPVRKPKLRSQTDAELERLGFHSPISWENNYFTTSSLGEHSSLITTLS